jgi:hypothetical protein
MMMMMKMALDVQGPPRTLQERRTNHAARRMEDSSSYQRAGRPCRQAAHMQAPLPERQLLTYILLDHHLDRQK